jgi:hypothetical protein
MHRSPGVVKHGTACRYGCAVQRFMLVFMCTA